MDFAFASGLQGRDVVCHASAWDLGRWEKTGEIDVRIKMCTKVNYEGRHQRWFTSTAASDSFADRCVVVWWCDGAQTCLLSTTSSVTLITMCLINGNLTSIVKGPTTDSVSSSFLAHAPC